MIAAATFGILAVVAPQAARADSVAWTGLRDASAVAADLAHGHLFVAEGSGYTGVVVTDLHGSPVSTITGLSGPNQLALSEDGNYVDVGLVGAAAIARIDTTTLQVAKLYPLPSNIGCPQQLADIDGKVWFGFSCNTGMTTGLATLDLGSGSVSVVPSTVPGTSTPEAPWWAPQLMTAPGHPHLLVAATDTEPASVYVYDTASNAPPMVRADLEAGHFALSPDGSTLYDGNYYRGILTSPLTSPSDQTQLSTTLADAIGVSPDGRYVVTGDRNGNVCAIDAATGAAARCLRGAGAGVVPGTAAVSLGGTSAAIVTGRLWPTVVGPPGARLRILDDPARAATSLSLSTTEPNAGDPVDLGHSGLIAPGSAISINGQLTAPAPGGASLTVTRTGPLGVTMPLLPVTTDSSGVFTITDRPLATGRYRYTVHYAGDPTQTPTVGEYDLDVQSPAVATPLVDNAGPEQVVDDPVHHLVFLSEYTAGDVRVFDELGNPVKTIGNLPGATGLLLAPDDSVLYVAVTKADEVVGLDPVTFAPTKLWLTGSLHQPAHLALVGSRMLVGYQGNGYGGGIAAFDPSIPGSPVTALSGGPTDDPVLVASPKFPGTVLVIDSPIEPAFLQLYDVGATALTDVTQGPDCGYELSLSADGNDVYCGTAELSYADLRPVRPTRLEYTAESPDGRLTAGFAQFGDYPLQLRVQPHGADDYTLSTTTQPSVDDNDNHITWSADGTRVITTAQVSTGPTGGHDWLYVMDAVPAAASSLTADVAGDLVGSALTLTGKLTTGDGTPISSQQVRVLKQTASAMTALTSVTSASDGAVSLPDTPDAVGPTTYLLEYDGALHQAPAVATVTVGVRKRAGSISLEGPPGPVGVGSSALLTAHLAEFHSGGTVTLASVAADGSETSVATSQVSTGGDVPFDIAPQVDTTYVARWSGDDWDTAASSQPVTVAVDPLTTITTAPPAVTRQRSASVAFTSTDPHAAFTCSLDGSAGSGCSSPYLTPPLTDGPHIINIVGRSAAGGTAVPAAVRWTIDTRAPVAHGRITLATGTSGHHVCVAWTGADPAPGAGVASYAVTVRDARGSVVYESAASPTRVVLPSLEGMTYRLSVTATDRAGNVSAPATASLSVPLDDRRFTVSRGWRRAVSSGDYDGSDLSSATRGVTARLTLRGARYVVWATTCSSCGKVNVIIDGRSTRTLDLYSAKTHHRVPFVVYSAAVPAIRTLTLRVNGRHDRRSHGSWVHLDALQTVP